MTRYELGSAKGPFMFNQTVREVGTCNIVAVLTGRSQEEAEEFAAILIEALEKSTEQMQQENTGENCQETTASKEVGLAVPVFVRGVIPSETPAEAGTDCNRLPD